MTEKKPNETVAWKRLLKLYRELRLLHLKDLFAENPNRASSYTIKFNDILFDYSKNIINHEVMSALLDLADEMNLKLRIEDMFNGRKINNTENRAAFHVALRNRSKTPMLTDGWDVMPNVKTVLNQMRKFVTSVHLGEWKGFTGERITDIVNIGIGGSDLGPAMVCHALKPFAVPGFNIHFISNVDPAAITEVLKNLIHEKTLFVISSKTFTTQETIANANTAKSWFLKGNAKRIEDIEKHFVAVSTNEREVKKFGINPDNMFSFWNWVGGRFSLWSAIGLSIALYLGMGPFEELLTGAYEMDLHFRESPFEANIPVILGLLGTWYNNFFQTKTYAIIPYDEYLEKFPDYLQQLEMESNGKRISKDGEEIDYPTSPVIWGKTGTNAQHSFFQLLHQGTQKIPVDFLAPVFNHNTSTEQHKLLIANFFAQTEALMKGKTKDEAKTDLENQGLSSFEVSQLLPHKIFPGNNPSNTILYTKLTPKTLGSLIAMYEHKVFVQGVIWNVNSFDQWGVELGKQLANVILKEINSKESVNNHDSSTNFLVNYYKRLVQSKDGI